MVAGPGEGDAEVDGPGSAGCEEPIPPLVKPEVTALLPVVSLVKDELPIPPFVKAEVELPMPALANVGVDLRCRDSKLTVQVNFCYNVLCPNRRSQTNYAPYRVNSQQYISQTQSMS